MSVSSDLSSSDLLDGLLFTRRGGKEQRHARCRWRLIVNHLPVMDLSWALLSIRTKSSNRIEDMSVKQLFGTYHSTRLENVRQTITFVRYRYAVADEISKSNEGISVTRERMFSMNCKNCSIVGMNRTDDAVTSTGTYVCDAFWMSFIKVATRFRWADPSSWSETRKSIDQHGWKIELFFFDF